MDRKHIIGILVASALVLPAMAWSGHHYGGYHHRSCGGMTTTWDMEKLDADGNGILTFEEYSAPRIASLRSGFDMIDQNKDGDIGENEWKALLEAHGVKME